MRSHRSCHLHTHILFRIPPFGLFLKFSFGSFLGRAGWPSSNNGLIALGVEFLRWRVRGRRHACCSCQTFSLLFSLSIPPRYTLISVLPPLCEVAFCLLASAFSVQVFGFFLLSFFIVKEHLRVPNSFLRLVRRLPFLEC